MKEGKVAKKTYLVEVALLTKSPLQGPLSYFTADKIKEGELLRVPVRRNLSPAIALSCRDARTAKSDIRRAEFVLRKISAKEVLGASVSPKTVSALKDTARFYATSLSNLLAALMPKMISAEPHIFLKKTARKPGPTRSGEKLLLQMESEERFGQYRALVRQNFARGHSVLFLTPTHLEAERAVEKLSKGIEEFTHVFTLSESPGEGRKIWQKARESRHPVLFITTPAGLFFERSDLATIVIERENSRAYQSLTKPFLNSKYLAESLARRHGYDLIMGDSVLSIETLSREKAGEFSENSLIRWRLQTSPSELCEASAGVDGSGKFRIFSETLQEFMKKAIEEDGRLFLYGARKGLSPTTVCADCGFVLPCLNCFAPMVLHEKGDGRIYLCHACGARREALTLCDHCGSWKLVSLGIGTQEIARQAAELFPKEKILILDKDHASTDLRAESIVRKFKEDGGILVGTELALLHLDAVPYSAVVSLDSLFSIPDFGVNERVFYLLSFLVKLFF